MPDSLTGHAPPAQPGQAIRHADRPALVQALQASRADTLAHFERCQAQLPGLKVPHWPTLNPPLWELGHIGWFQAHWLGRNPHWDQGVAADPDAPRRPDPRPNADALFDSSHVPHASRWQLPLPDADTTRADLARQLADTLALLADAPDTDAGLYFFRLALLHEDMHHEAGLYMAQALGLHSDDARWQAPALPRQRGSVALPAGPVQLGWRGEGFAFDNELGAHTVPLAAFHIDSRVLRWDEYLPFIAAGGYQDERWWRDDGLSWLQQTGAEAPRYLQRDPAQAATEHPLEGWQQWQSGRWAALPLDAPACHLSAHEAEAWCAWAGRRLPTEAEWEAAALRAPEAFAWGAVWEWTASPFTPYPGFAPHPYRDYSAPWFGSRRVLRGASFMTQPRMAHPRYRNFFMAERNDVPAGFRSCAL